MNNYIKGGSILSSFFSNLGQENSSSGSTRYGQYSSQSGIYHTSNENSISSQYGARGIEITDLQPGESFEGEVASVNGQDVQLKLAQGQYMAAKLEGDVQLALGQILHFQVQSNQDSKIVLKPIYTNMLQQRVGEAALKAANIAVNEKNMQMVGTMIENGMSINKDSLMQFNRLVLQHPQTEVSEIINLNKMHIPITDNNITQYENYQNLEHKLMDAIKDTSNDIFKIYEELSSNAEKTDANRTIALSNPASMQQSMKFMDKVLQFISEEPSDISMKSANTVESPAINITENQLQNNSVSDAILNNDVTSNNIQLEGNINISEETNQTIIEDVKSNANNLAENNAIKTSQAVSQSKNDIVTDFMQQIKNVPTDKLPDKVISFLNNNNNLNGKELMYLLGNDSELVRLLDEYGKDKVYRSHAFKNVLRNNLTRQWTLNPNDIAEDGKISEFYRKLVKQSQQLSQIMEDAAHGSNINYSRSAQNIHNNIDFMNSLNQMFHYIQIPLKLSNGHANGELYVYTNKKNLAHKDGTLTAILHLDMDHLGALDVNISLNMDSNTVTTKFYMDKDSISLVEQHIDELNDRLAVKGYKFHTFIEKRDNSKTVFEQMEQQTKGAAAPLSYQAFDIRA